MEQKRNSGGARFAAAGLLAGCCVAWQASQAVAATVTVGPALPLPSPFPTKITCASPCTLTNASLPFGASYRSPIDGVIVRWRVMGVKGYDYRLRVITPLDGSLYLGAASSSPRVPMGKEIETFPASLPIRAGQMVGMNLGTTGTPIAWESNGSAPLLQWQPPLGDEEARAALGEGAALVFGFNADVQPRPELSFIAPSSGPIGGGTQVTIAGDDLSGVTGVSFGGAPASFVLDADDRVVATAPPGGTPGPVAVAVATRAGVTPNVPAAQFTYMAAGQPASTPCVVPKLKGKRLEVAKRRLREAGCGIGQVKKLRGARARTGRVHGQRPKPRSILTSGAKVNVTLKKSGPNVQTKKR